MPSNPVPPIYVVEYSPTQRAGHVLLLEEAIRHNERNLALGTPRDYLIVGQALDYEVAHQICHAFRRVMGDIPEDPRPPAPE